MQVSRLTRITGSVSNQRERIRTMLMPYGIGTRTETTMSERDSTIPVDAASEITDAMMSSLADVVKNVISDAETTPIIETENENREPSEKSNLSSNSSAEHVSDGSVDDLVSEGEAAHRSGDHKSALQAFNKAIALDPSNSMAWFNRGVLLEAEQDSRGAKQAFVICLDLDPNHGPALANLAVLLDRLGDVDGALEIANRALQYFPGHPHLVKIMEQNKAAGGIIHSKPTIMPHTQEKLVDQTLTHAVDATSSTTAGNEISVIDTNLQEEDRKINNHEESTGEEELIEETVEEELTLDEICEEATSVLTKGDAKGALELLKEHLHGEAAQHFDSWRIAAGAMAALGLDDHAISAYTHAIGLNSNNSKCHFNLGALHERKGNVDAAMKCFVNALEIDSQYVKAARRLANTAESNSDIPNLLKARRLLVKEPEGKENLASLLLQLAEGESNFLDNTGGLPPTIPEGPALAAEAIELCEENTEMMGRALSAAGKHTDAVKTWKAMIQEDKNNPDLWVGLARALEAAGDVDTAQRCHQKARNLANPQNNELSQQQAVVGNNQENLYTQTEYESSEKNVPQPVPTPLPPNTVNQPVPTPSPPPIETGDEMPLLVPQPVPTPSPPPISTNMSQGALPELTERPEPVPLASKPKPEVDLAAAALEATSRLGESLGIESNSNSIANQDIEWYNKGVGLIEDKKYREALSCFDRALPSFADNDEMIIRILNGRGNALYYLEDYPKCVESYHKAMVINPKGVQGKTLYNMGTAYAEMQRFSDAIKCFEQAIPRGLDKNQQKLAKEQIRRCNILHKEQQRKMS